MSEKVKVVRAFLREIGSKGGRTTAARMSKTERSEAARRAVNVRWANHVKKGRKGKGK